MMYRLKTQIPFGNDKHEGNRTCKLWLAASLVSMCMGAASAQQPRARFAVHPAQVELAMERVQLPTHGVELKLAAPVTSSSADTRLEIKSVTMVNPRELRLRISCGEVTECLPFFALATYPQAIDASNLSAKLDAKAAGSERTVHDANQSKAAAPASTPVMRSGSSATLDMDSNKVHVKIEVVCLESGAAGDKVRVATRDRKLVYVAEVVNSKLLKGTF